MTQPAARQGPLYAPERGARYVSLRLENLLWRQGSHAVLEYRALSSVNYPPGTFSLLWVPGYEAIPMTPVQRGASLVYIVKAVGETTARLVNDPPRHAGAIGPLGAGWRYAAEKGPWLHVAGGTGVAAALSILRVAKPALLAYGARSGADLVPIGRLGLAEAGVQLYYATEDGSKGFQGTVLALAEKLLQERHVAALTAAGPTPLLCGAARLADEYGLPLYIAPEALVRCGLGFCGRCSLGCGGKLLCRDGLYLAKGDLDCWLAERCG